MVWFCRRNYITRHILLLPEWFLRILLVSTFNHQNDCFCSLLYFSLPSSASAKPDFCNSRGPGTDMSPACRPRLRYQFLNLIKAHISCPVNFISRVDRNLNEVVSIVDWLRRSSFIGHDAQSWGSDRSQRGEALSNTTKICGHKLKELILLVAIAWLLIRALGIIALVISTGQQLLGLTEQGRVGRETQI